jgi:hypothetical protein
MNPAHSFINLIFSKNFLRYPKVARKEEGSCTYSLRAVGFLQLQVGLRHAPPPSRQLPILLLIFPCAGIFHNVETHIWLGWCPCFLLTGSLEPCNKHGKSKCRRIHWTSPKLRRFDCSKIHSCPSRQTMATSFTQKQQNSSFGSFSNIKADRGELLHRVLTHCQQLLMIGCKKYH